MIESKNLFGIKGKNFDVRIEYNEDYVIVHLPKVEVFNKSSFLEMKKLLKDWLDFFKTLGKENIFAAVEIGTKENKLASMLNFKYAGRSENMNVYIYGE